MQKLELLTNNIPNVYEQYNNILSLNSVLTVLPEYYLATAILSMAIFFAISPKIQSKSFKQIKFSLFSSISFQFNYLAVLIIFFYCFLSVKQNFLFLADFVSFNNSLHNDFISLLAKLIIGISSLVYLIFVQQFLTDQKLNYFEYYILILTSILGFCLLCCSDDLLTAYLAIELQSLAFYVLASFKRNSNYSVESGVKYFILGSFSTILFLFGSNLIYGLSGSISIIDFKDLFIWIFSANSFFLSFESISKALESFQDKTFKLENKDLQIIYDKFLILKNNVYLNSSDFNNLFMELDINKLLFFEEIIDYQKLNYYKNISQKMIQIANQIDSSSYNYYRNHLENVKEISPSIQFVKDLVIDDFFQNSAIWFLTDMQNLGNEYKDISELRKDLGLINDLSDLSNKFKYNWFCAKNFNPYFTNLEHMMSALTKNQIMGDINELFYFTHLSSNLNVLPLNNVDGFMKDEGNFYKKFELITKKLELLGYISLFDANLILLEIKSLLNDKMLLNLKNDEISFFKNFSEVLTGTFKKKNFDSTDLSTDEIKIKEICHNIALIISDYNTIENNKNILKYFHSIVDILPNFLLTQNIISYDLNYNDLNDEQKYNLLKFIIFKLKNYNEISFLTKWEFKFLLNEIENINYNLPNDLEKKKLYLELSQVLHEFFLLKSNRNCKELEQYLREFFVLNSNSNCKELEQFLQKFSVYESNCCKESEQFFVDKLLISEMFQFHSSIKNMSFESELKHDIISKTLAYIYNLENSNILYNTKFSLDQKIPYLTYTTNQNNESDIILLHIVTLFSLFFDFSYSFNDNSNFIFDTTLIELGVLIVLISLFFKLALSPFHLWSPDVYEGSPSSSTFFFTVISKLSIFVFLLKICYISFYSIIANWQLYSLIVAIISIIVGSVGGLKQRKFKSILAYSSISNMGLILVSFSAGNFEGIKAFFYFFILYIISGLAIWSIFLLLKLKKKIPSEKHNKDLGDFSLLHELNGILAYASVITIFTIAGIPPMVGFLAKVSIFLSLTEASMYCIALISILASVISTFFYLRVLKVIFFENVLVGKLFHPTNSKDNIIRSLLFFLILFLFISPSLPSFFAYKTTLFLNKNFY